MRLVVQGNVTILRVLPQKSSHGLPALRRQRLAGERPLHGAPRELAIVTVWEVERVPSSYPAGASLLSQDANLLLERIYELVLMLGTRRQG